MTADKYIQGPIGGEDCLDVCIEEVAPSVTFPTTPSGLRISIRTTTMNVTDVATPLPAVALAQRNAISVQNLDTVETLYIGNSDVTADRVLGTTAGLEVGAQESFNLDITPSITLYGRAPTGKTILIKVTEIA